MADIIRSRNIFIDSEQYHTRNGEKVIVNFPASSFHVLQGEHMRLTLTAFEMRKNFYNINSNNNKFYLYQVSTSNYVEMEIAVGDYYRFGSNATISHSLCRAIQQAIVAGGCTGLLTTDVTYNVITRKITIDMSNVTAVYTTGDYFVTFQIPVERQGSGITGVSDKGIFNDSYEILGTRPTRYTDDIIQAFDNSTTDTFEGFYPASLFSIEALYLQANIITNNYTTPSFGADSVSTKLIPSQILARIAIPYADMFEKTQDQPAIITYTDPNDLFTVNLQQNQIDTIVFEIIDSKGRRIEEVSPNQADDGSLSFSCVLRWDVVKENTMGLPVRELTDRIDALFRRQGLN